MWVIKKQTLRDFWERPGNASAEAPLRAWYAVVSQARWQDFADLKETYGNASLVGDCVVFNIAGNKYRLVVRIRFQRHKVFVLRIMTHKEYDLDSWKTDCGCFTKPESPARRQDTKPPEQAPKRKKKSG